MIESIRPVTLEDILGLERYEKERDEIRRRIIALKKKRRVPVGDRVTFVFENHETIFFQIQEMIRAESIRDLDAIREEIEVYNGLLPDEGQLATTMLIEITEEVDIERELLRLLGIDECVRLEIGDQVVAGEFDPHQSRDDRISAVQYVRFSVPEAARAVFGEPDGRVRLVIDHRNYKAATDLDGETRRALYGDLVPAE